jgi:hypothetical protein
MAGTGNAKMENIGKLGWFFQKDSNKYIQYHTSTVLNLLNSWKKMKKKHFESTRIDHAMLTIRLDDHLSWN